MVIFDLNEKTGEQTATEGQMGDTAEYASVALEIVRNGYINGTTVRLDGAIRMQPR